MHRFCYDRSLFQNELSVIEMFQFQFFLTSAGTENHEKIDQMC